MPDGVLVGGEQCPVPSPAGEKVRPIDNAKKGKHNEATVAAEKLVLCNTAQPVVDARALVEAAQVQGLEDVLQHHRLQTGGEDMPNAFRTVPCAPEDYMVNVTGIFHPETGEWKFQELWALMFGYASGVVNFNRWAKFLEAVVRRIGGILFTMYYDDGSLRDFESAEGTGQLVVRRFFASVGALLADKKRQQMSEKAIFLGLEHDVGKALLKDIVTFWPRPGLVLKEHDRVDAVKGKRRLHIWRGEQAHRPLGFYGHWHVGASGETRACTPSSPYAS